MHMKRTRESIYVYVYVYVCVCTGMICHIIKMNVMEKAGKQWMMTILMC